MARSRHVRSHLRRRQQRRAARVPNKKPKTELLTDSSLESAVLIPKPRLSLHKCGAGATPSVPLRSRMRNGALGQPAPPARPSDCGRSLPEPRSLAGRVSVPCCSTPTGLGAQLRSGRGARQQRRPRPSRSASRRTGGPPVPTTFARGGARTKPQCTTGSAREERAARERRASRRLRIRRRGLRACRRGGGIGAKRPRRMVILPARYGRFTACLSAAQNPPGRSRSAAGVAADGRGSDGKDCGRAGAAPGSARSLGCFTELRPDGSRLGPLSGCCTELDELRPAR